MHQKRLAAARTRRMGSAPTDLLAGFLKERGRDKEGGGVKTGRDGQLTEGA